MVNLMVINRIYVVKMIFFVYGLKRKKEENEECLLLF